MLPENNQQINTGQQVLEQIKDQNLKPKPKWEFLLKDYLIWGFFGAAIIVGSLATAVIIFVTTHSSWPFGIPEGGYLSGFLLDLPYFWLVGLFIFLLLAFYNFKHTKTGYRYNTYLIFLGSIALSLILGSGIYAAGGGEKLEDIFFRQVPLYRQFISSRGQIFTRLEEGRLAGVVVEVNSDFVKVLDFNGQTWILPTTTAELFVGQRIKMVGDKRDDNIFIPETIRPWFGPGPNSMQMHMIIIRPPKP